MTVFISLDLEMNKPSNKIIQVGVCLSHIDGIEPNAEYPEFPKTYVWYLDPQEPISPFITELTGITDDDIRDKAVSHERCASELSALIDQHNCFINPVTWGGGDSSLLIHEFKDRGIDFNKFGRRWIDVKTIHTYLCLSRFKTPKGGLKSCMGMYGLKFIGDAHRADFDALNTLRLFFHLMKRNNTLENVAATLKDFK